MESVFEVLWALVILFGVLSRLLGGGTARRADLPRRRLPVPHVPAGRGGQVRGAGPARPEGAGRVPDTAGREVEGREDGGKEDAAARGAAAGRQASGEPTPGPGAPGQPPLPRVPPILLPRVPQSQAPVPRPTRPSGWPIPDLGWPFDEIFGWDDAEAEASRAEPARAPEPGQAPAAEGLPPPGEAMPSGEGPALRRQARQPVPAAAAAGREDAHRKARGTAAAAGLSPLARAVAWSVILGPPRAYEPWRPVGWRRGV